MVRPAGSLTPVDPRTPRADVSLAIREHAPRALDTPRQVLPQACGAALSGSSVVTRRTGSVVPYASASALLPLSPVGLDPAKAEGMASRVCVDLEGVRRDSVYVLL